MKVISVDAITQHITQITYSDGSSKIISEPLTLEDLANMERKDEWLKAQLDFNRRTP